MDKEQQANELAFIVTKLGAAARSVRRIDKNGLSPSGQMALTLVTNASSALADELEALRVEIRAKKSEDA